MRRIAVIGCGGAGKTTVGRAIAQALGLPLVHVDHHRFRDGSLVPPEEWQRIHDELVAGEEWVLEGMRIGGTLERRLERADAVVFLDLPLRSCLAGISRRRLRRERPELALYTRVPWEFVRWVLAFRRRHRPALVEALRRHRGGTRVVVLRSRREVHEFLTPRKLSQFAGIGPETPLHRVADPRSFPRAASTERE